MALTVTSLLPSLPQRVFDGDYPTAMSADDSAISAGGAAVTLTIAAVTGKPIILRSVVCGYDTTPTGGSLTIKDGSTTVFVAPIGAAGTVIITFDPPKKATVGNAVSLVMAAGGGSVVAYVNANAYTLG